MEIMTFSLVGGVEADVAGFVAADASVQTGVAYQQPGLLRRTLASGADGRWAVVTLWSSAADADRAFAAAVRHPAVVVFDAFVAPGSRMTERFTPLG